MMENVNGLSLDLIIHPGETIKEVLEDKKMTQEELAIRTGFSSKHISEVISGKKNISSKFANSLEYALGIPTTFWINLQGIYDKEIIEIERINNVKEKEFNVLKDLKEIVKYCENENIIKKDNSKAVTVLNMRRFLNLNDLTTIPNLQIQKVAFRGSKKAKINVNVLYAWKKICEYFTEKIIPVNTFNKQELTLRYDDIKKTMFLEPNEMVKRLKEIFLDCGIVFEVVKNFVGAPVQGFIQKKNNKVILCMTLRYSFCDIFWFTLFHEIAHLLNDDFTDQYIDYNFVESKEENLADEFARNTLINPDDYSIFVEKGKYSVETIKSFAISQGVLPGIIVGRIQNDFKDYSFMSNLREKYKWISS